MRWLIVILLAIGIAVLFVRHRSVPPPSPSVASPAPVAVSSTAPPAAPPAAMPAAAPRTTAVPPMAGASPQRNISGELNALAARTGVRLLAFQPGAPGQAVIAIEWSGDNAALGGDFIEAALRERIIHDFDPTPSLGQRMQQGRRFFTARYQLKF